MEFKSFDVYESNQYKQPLINKRYSLNSAYKNSNNKYYTLENELNKTQHDYYINVEDIALLLDKDKIKTGFSSQLLDKKGGVESLFFDLKVDKTAGIDDTNKDDIEKRTNYFGKNVPLLPVCNSLWSHIFSTFKNKILIFFLVCAFFRLLMDIFKESYRLFDAVLLYIIVVVISILNGISKSVKDKIIINLHKNLSNKTCRVLRSGKEKIIHQKHLLVGDILITTAGDTISNDGIIIKAFSIELIDHNDQLKEFNFINYCDSYYSNFSFKINNFINNMNYNNSNSNSNTKNYPLILSGSKIIKGFAYVLILSVGENVSTRKLNTNKLIDNSIIFSYKYGLIENNNSNNNNLSVKDNNEDKIAKHNIMKKSFLKTKDRTYSDCFFKDKKSENLEETNLIRKESNKNMNLTKNYSFSNNNYASLNKNKPINKLSSISVNSKEEFSLNKSVNNKQGKFYRLFEFLSNEYRFMYKGYLANYVYKIEKLSFQIGFVCGLIFFILQVLRFINSHNNYLSLEFVILDDLVNLLVIVILALPEGLHLILVLTIAKSIHNLSKKNIYVKNIESLEDLGCLDIICTDYNGILTKNKSNINSVYIEGEHIINDSIKNIKSMISEDSYLFLTESLAINSTAFSVNTNGINTYYGLNTECSLIKLLSLFNEDYLEYRNNINRPIIDRSPNSLDATFSYTIIEMIEKNDKIRVYITGEFYSIINNIKYCIDKEDNTNIIEPKIVLFSISYKNKLELIINSNKIKNGSRGIILAYKDIEKNDYYNLKFKFNRNKKQYINKISSDLTFISLVELEDELKEDTIEYINKCNKSGLNIKMFTNQNKHLAKLNAVACGLIDESNENNNSKLKINEKTLMKSDTDIILANNNKSENTNNNYILKKRNTINIPKEMNRCLSLDILEFKDTFKTLLEGIEINNSIISDKKLLNNTSNINICNENNLLDINVIKDNTYDNNYNNININDKFDVSLFKKFLDSKIIYNSNSKEKLLIIRMLSELGYIVAVTGDCINDSEAAQDSHISIAIGKQCTDIMKETSDVIIQDDNNNYVIEAVIYGRYIYDNISKFLNFYITFIISTLSIIIVTSLPGYIFCFFPAKLLWINFIVNTLGVVAFSLTNPWKDDLINRGPYLKNTQLIHKDTNTSELNNKKDNKLSNLLLINRQKISILNKTSKNTILNTEVLIRIIIKSIIIFSLVYALFIYEENVNILLKQYQDNFENIKKLEKFIHFKKDLFRTSVLHILTILHIYSSFICRIGEYKHKHLFYNLKKDYLFFLIQFTAILLQLLIIQAGKMLTNGIGLSLKIHVICFCYSLLLFLSIPISKFVIFIYNKITNSNTKMFEQINKSKDKSNYDSIKCSYENKKANLSSIEDISEDDDKVNKVYKFLKSNNKNFKRSKTQILPEFN